ncbi:histone H3 [Klebsormidium nitens]|uniref:Histone H3 n=1 Tax=Klebsormidium nitens TaxID=105231 RepID=A0A1Y1IUA2_KLENI|nr:histone H3 [Klebsormidium nitens]|eukprot:GAQ92406.1 histone H3 [Klebsormidium nitens]
MRQRLQRGHQAEKVAAPEDEVVGDSENPGGAQVPPIESEPAIDILEVDEFGLHADWGLEDYLSYVETLATQNKWSPEKKAEAEAHYQAKFAELNGEQSPPRETMQTEEGASPEEVRKERGVISPEEYMAELEELVRWNAPFEKPFGDSEPDDDNPQKSGHLNAAGEGDPDAPTESELQAEMMFKQHARGEEAPEEVEEEEEGGELQSMLGDPGREMDPAEQLRRHKAALESFGKTSRELVTAGKQPQKKRRSKATGRKPNSVWGVVGGKKPVAGAALLAGKPEAAGATGQKGSGGAQKEKKVAPTGAIGKPAAGEGKQTLEKGGSGKAVVGAKRKSSVAITPPRPEKKPRRYKPGTLALREIRKYQKSTDFLIPKSTFARIVKRLCSTYLKQQDLRWQASALDALLEASQDFVVGLFGDAVFCQAHGKRKTLMKKDLDLAKRIRGIRNEDDKLPLQEAVEHVVDRRDTKVYDPNPNKERWKPPKQVEREAREKGKSDAARRTTRAAQGPQGGAETSKAKDKGKTTARGPEEGAKTEKRKETKAKQGPGVGAKSSGERAEVVEGALEEFQGGAEKSKPGGESGEASRTGRPTPTPATWRQACQLGSAL